MPDTEHRSLTNRRILVTGGAGFIGSHLAETLASTNEVIVVDNLSSGLQKNVPNDAELVIGDIRDRQTVASVIDGVDIIFHQAAVVSVEDSIYEPERTQEINAAATLQLLELARQEGARIVVASSAAVYGQPETVPIPEDESLKPLSPYGLSKVTADEYTRLYAELYNVPAIALRYFNVYGPRQTGDYAGVIDVFLNQIQSDDALTVHGDGSQTRDFVHINDVVKANLLAATRGTPGTAYNIGTGRSISIQELAKLIVQITGSDVPIENVRERDGDIKRSCADVTRAMDQLGYDPSVEIQEGLEELHRKI